MSNNDLISRSDIKDHIGELLLVYSGAELANAILNAIDNAPSVELRVGDKATDEDIETVKRLMKDYKPQTDFYIPVDNNGITPV